MKRIYLFLALLCCVAVHAQTGPASQTNHAASLNADQLKIYQSVSGIIDKYLVQQKDKLHLTDKDVDQYVVSDIYSNSKSGTTYVYLHQQYSGIRIFNAVSTLAVHGGKVSSFASRFYSNAESKANTLSPALSPTVAISKAAENLQLKLTESPAQIERNEKDHEFVYSKSGISREPIRVSLVYQPVKSGFRLAWNVNLRLIDGSHWWNVRIDAVTGQFLQKNDWTTHCDFGAGTGTTDESSLDQVPSKRQINSAPLPQTARQSTVPVYDAFPLPVESPNHGSRALLSDPSDPVASPYGWHDDNGAAGAEYTITRGNNVYAYEDTLANDQPGYSPDGGAALNFDFPLNLSLQPRGYLDASITNLFYVNNTLHDVLYHNGFDEVSGNYQSNNYGHGGSANDYVLAEAEDGSGTNNANFSAPVDGQSGTMQMYLWTGGGTATLVINSPASIAGTYTAATPGWGGTITVPITQDLVLVNDGTGTVTDACDPLVNGAALSGKIAVIDRGTCNFVDKVLAVQNAGAIAAIVVNNVAGAPFAMGDNGNGASVTIPAVMISQTDGATIKTVLNLPAAVNGTLNPPAGGTVDIDGDLDNGIITHEFCHGVSIRLTGGPGNSNCLDNGEEGGEGWSDWLALMMTIEPGDHGTDPRPMGTYAFREPPSGAGIRRYPYSTDMSIDPETYGFLAQSAEVHDIGEVWCTTVWDMSWALIDQYGFDPDWYHGTSGNNIALQLVLEGMKLQPCGPGFLDARDAILAADDNLFGGVHKCLIWSAFARRGMGANASQGDANTAGDETEDFSLPAICQNPTSPPTANFTSDVTSTCIGTVHFTDQSTNIAQTWTWDFGDSTSSILENPAHTYTAPGTYTVKLVVTNTLGADSLTRTAYIQVSFPANPVITGNTTLCPGDSTTLTAALTSGNTAEWSDSSGSNLLATGTTFQVPPVTNNITYTVRQVTNSAVLHVGPVDGTIGAGGYHNSSFEGRLLFTANAPFRLKSVWVDASGTANRTFNLYSSTGTLIQSLVVNVPGGQGRVTLNFNIPSAGNYQIGVTAGSNLYRNNAGASYPYTINGLVSITASNSTTNPATYYYYLYDWEVQETPCMSPAIPVAISIVPAPVSAFTYSATGLSYQFTDASVGAVSWTWDFGDTTATSNAESPSKIFAHPGTYSVTLTVTNAAGCQSISTQTITVTNVGIASLAGDPVQVFSTGNQVIVRFSKAGMADTDIRITDVLGRELSQAYSRYGNMYTCHIEDLDAGYVLVTVKSEGQILHKKVLITQE